MAQEIKSIRILKAALAQCERQRDKLRERLKPAKSRPARATKPTRAPRTTKPTRGLVTGRNEALAWLAATGNPDPFASNVFSRAQAQAMVGALYSAGAALVQVSGIHNEPWRQKTEGGAYADTLMVTPQRGKLETLTKMLKVRFEADEVDGRDGKIRAWWD